MSPQLRRARLVLAFAGVDSLVSLPVLSGSAAGVDARLLGATPPLALALIAVVAGLCGILSYCSRSLIRHVLEGRAAP